MRQTEFLNRLSVAALYLDWSVVGGKLVGCNLLNKRLFNVITAVSFYETGNYNRPTLVGTRAAAKKLGLSEALMKAMFSPDHRGHGQVLRGKLLKAVDGCLA